MPMKDALNWIVVENDRIAFVSFDAVGGSRIQTQTTRIGQDIAASENEDR